MPVISALELHDQAASGGCPRHAQGAHGGLGPAVDEPQTFDRRHAGLDQLGQPNFAWAGHAERPTGLRRRLDGADHRCVGVAQQQRAERSDVVDEALSAFVPDKGALSSHERRWFAAHGAIGANRAVHAARKQVEGSLAPAGAGDRRHSAPRSLVISAIGRWIAVRIGVSRTVERRLSVPRRSRTSSPNAARSSVSYATRKSMSSTPNE